MEKNRSIDESDFINLANKVVGVGLIGTGEKYFELANEYAEQEAIGFAEFIKDNHYTKGYKGWYKFYTQVTDYPEGFSMSIPVYEFLTIKEIYQLYKSSQSKIPSNDNS